MSDGSTQSNLSRIKINALTERMEAVEAENQFLMTNLENAYKLLKEHKEVLELVCEKTGLIGPATEISGDEVALAVADKERSEADKAELAAIEAESAELAKKKAELEALEAKQTELDKRRALLGKK